MLFSARPEDAGRWGWRTNGQPDLLLLVGQAIVIVQVEEPLGPPVPQELWLQAEEDAEVALAAHHPDGEPRRLQETAHLQEGFSADRDAGASPRERAPARSG